MHISDISGKGSRASAKGTLKFTGDDGGWDAAADNVPKPIVEGSDGNPHPTS